LFSQFKKIFLNIVGNIIFSRMFETYKFASYIIF